MKRSGGGVQTVAPRLLRKWLAPRRADAHKGDFGHVLVLGGSRGLAGAAQLCAAGALRGGAGLVTWGMPAGLEASARPPWEAMTLSLPQAGGALSAAAARPALKFMERRGVTALALGPGLSAAPGAARLVKVLLSRTPAPVVLDADGLNALAAGGWPARAAAPLAMTPHPGEMARLLRTDTRAVQADRAGAALRLARTKNVICVLKGQGTLVCDGRRVWRNPTGNPGMATGGTGDVLCGLIAALADQTSGKDAREKLLRAALIGVYVHGLAGDLAARRKTRVALKAGDLLEGLPEAFRKTFGRTV